VLRGVGFGRLWLSIGSCRPSEDGTWQYVGGTAEGFFMVISPHEEDAMSELR